MKPELKFGQYNGYTIEELKELHKNSTVATWYAHPGQVRGPFCRWFEVTEVEPQYQKHVAYKGDDTKYCAAAMNALPDMMALVEKQAKEIEIAKAALKRQGLQAIIRKMEEVQ